MSLYPQSCLIFCCLNNLRLTDFDNSTFTETEQMRTISNPFFQPILDDRNERFTLEKSDTFEPSGDNMNSSSDEKYMNEYTKQDSIPSKYNTLLKEIKNSSIIQKEFKGKLEPQKFGTKARSQSYCSKIELSMPWVSLLF